MARTWRAATRWASSPIPSPCSLSSCCSGSVFGWPPRAGASSPWATGWPRSWASRSAARASRGTRDKGWVGLGAFVVFGTLAAAFLSAWVARWSLDPGAPHWPRTIGVACALALACALVESLPTTLDDNVTVPLAVALVLPLVAAAEPALLLGDPLLTKRALVGLAANVAIAVPGLPGTVDRPLRGRLGGRSSERRSPPASACPASPSWSPSSSSAPRPRSSATVRRPPAASRRRRAAPAAGATPGRTVACRRSWPCSRGWPRRASATCSPSPTRPRSRPPPPTPARPRWARPTAGARSSSRPSGPCRRAPKAR